MTEKGTFQTKVVNIPELLEAILLHLDIRTLLVSAQRVCQPWTALIQTSPAIQQALFFQPKQGKWQTKSSGSSILSSTTENNDTKLDEGSINGYESGFPSPQLIYNPLLVQAFRPFFPSAHEYPPIQNAYDEKATEVQTQPYFSHKALDMLSSPQKKIAYMRKEASWRKMLLRQPPVYGGVTIFKMHHGRGGDSCRCYEVQEGNPDTCQEKKNSDDDNNTLRMGHFFTVFVQNKDLYFGRFGHTRVYWSAYVPPVEPDTDGEDGRYPPEGGSYSEVVKKEFAKAIEKSEVVVFSREVIQCSVGGRKPTQGQILRMEIAKAGDGAGV